MATKTLSLSLGIEGSEEDGWQIVLEGLPDGPVRSEVMRFPRADVEAEARIVAMDTVAALRTKGIVGDIRVREAS